MLLYCKMVFNINGRAHTHTHTHTHIYIYIFKNRRGLYIYKRFIFSQAHLVNKWRTKFYRTNVKCMKPRVTDTTV